MSESVNQQELLLAAVRDVKTALEKEKLVVADGQSGTTLVVTKPGKNPLSATIDFTVKTDEYETVVKISSEPLGINPRLFRTFKPDGTPDLNTNPAKIVEVVKDGFVKLRALQAVPVQAPKREKSATEKLFDEFETEMTGHKIKVRTSVNPELTPDVEEIPVTLTFTGGKNPPSAQAVLRVISNEQGENDLVLFSQELEIVDVMCVLPSSGAVVRKHGTFKQVHDALEKRVENVVLDPVSETLTKLTAAFIEEANDSKRRGVHTSDTKLMDDSARQAVAAFAAGGGKRETISIARTNIEPNGTLRGRVEVALDGTFDPEKGELNVVFRGSAAPQNGRPFAFEEKMWTIGRNGQYDRRDADMHEQDIMAVVLRYLRPGDLKAA